MKRSPDSSEEGASGVAKRDGAVDSPPRSANLRYMGRRSIPIRNSNAGSWREHLLSELDKLEQLPAGTDNFSPHRPRSEVLNFARQIADSLKREDLLLPLLAAGSDGSLQIKWQKDSRELSFFISPAGAEFVRVSSSGEIEEGPLREPAQANELIAWMLAAA